MCMGKYENKGVLMKKKKVRINLTIDDDLNKEWFEIAKKYGWTKSGMLEDILKNILPVMSLEDPRKILAGAVKESMKSLKDINKFIEGYEHAQHE